MDIKPLKITGTRETPDIEFVPEDRKFIIKGNSFPGNTELFYKPILEWTEQFVKNYNDSEPIEIEFRFEYFNTSSAKYIFELIKIFEELVEKGIEVSLKWYYYKDDPDMLETGKDFASNTEVKFTFVEQD